MKIVEAATLKVGDRVHWTDPDDGARSREMTIDSIEFHEGGDIFIIDTYGNHYECNYAELHWCSARESLKLVEPVITLQEGMRRAGYVEPSTEELVAIAERMTLARRGRGLEEGGEE